MGSVNMRSGNLILIMKKALSFTTVLLFVSGGIPFAFAENPSASTPDDSVQPTNGKVYSAMPSDDPDDGKFLAVAGSNLQTLAGMTIQLFIGVPAGRPTFEIGIFDGDVGDNWDLGSGLMGYWLYKDPLKSGATPLLSSWTSSGLANDDWTNQYFSTDDGAKAPSGNYFYRLVVGWKTTIPYGALDEFKVRTDGQISVRNGQSVGYLGAPQRIDLDPWVGSGDPNPGETNDPDANSYNGYWDLYFYVPTSRNAITFRDGDADRYNDYDDPNTPNTDPDGAGPAIPEGQNLGAPPDGGGGSGECCVVSPAVLSRVTDPDGNVYVNSNPSGNTEWERYIISNESNADVQVDYDLSAGLWNYEIVGLDAHNTYFVDVEYELFSGPEPPLPVSMPPIIVPEYDVETEPDNTLYFAHRVTNRGKTDIFDLKARLSHGWETHIYQDTDGDGVLDPGEPEVSATPSMQINESYDIIVSVYVPSGTRGEVDDVIVTASSTKEWAVQDNSIDSITVKKNEPPVADSGGPYVQYEGSVVEFNASGSYDPDGDKLEYRWDFENDGTWDTNWSFDPTATHIYWDDYAGEVAVEAREAKMGLVIDHDEEIQFSSYVNQNISHAQSFVPTESTVSDVYLVVASGRKSSEDDLHVSIRESLDGPILTEATLPYNVLPDTCFNNPAEFVKFDFPDVTVTPGETYYVQVESPHASPKGEYGICGTGADFFEGVHWMWKRSAGWSKTEDSGWFDLAFKIDQLLQQAPEDPLSDIDITTITIHNVAPTVEWTSKSKDGTILNPPYPEGKEIQFEAKVDDPGIFDTFTYEWRFGDGWIFVTDSPSFIYTYGDNDTYTVVVKVTDDDGGVGIDDTPPLEIYNVDPDVQVLIPYCIFYEGEPGCDLLGIFSDPGWLDTHIAHWEFGDGLTKTQIPNEENDPPEATGDFNTTHVYGDDGTYKVNATVVDDDGGEDTSRGEMYIINKPPSLLVSEPSAIDEGQAAVIAVNASDQGSDDIYLLVDWGDGTSDKKEFFNNGLGPDPPQSPSGIHPFEVSTTLSHSYGDNGEYEVTITASDDDGGGTSESVNVTVLNVAPSISPFGSLTVDEGLPLTIAATSTDPGSDDLTFIWEFELGPTFTSVHYNDGVGPDPYPSPGGKYPFSATDKATQTYGDNGKYTVTLTVKDDDGGTTSYTKTITVNNVEPAITPFGPFTVDEGSPFNISAISTDPGSDDLNFTWEFELGPTIVHTYYNDGVGPDPYPSPGGTYPFTKTDTVEHIYGDDGVFNVTLTVEDDDEGSVSYTTTITVSNLDPTIVPFGPFTIDEGSPLDLTATASDAGSDDLTFTWEFEYGPTFANVHYNDGVGPDPYPSPGGTYPFTTDDSVQHTYGDDGAFNVTLTVEDDDGGTATYVTTITVGNVAPTVDVQAYILVNFTLRIAGEKWHNVELFIYADGEEIGYAEVVRYPGNPDMQAVSTGYVKCDITKTITAKVVYTPEDDPVNGQPNGANPVWLKLAFEDSSKERLKHTFNVQHPETWVWNVEINPYLVGKEITFEATATDPGSDDLTFTWNWGDGSPDNGATYFNDGVGPDPYPSPEGTYPFTATDMQKHTFKSKGEHIVTLTVEDDDGGVTVTTITISTG